MEAEFQLQERTFQSGTNALCFSRVIIIYKKMILSRLFKRIWRYYIDKSSSAVKIRYLRKQGIKIGDNCLVAGLSYTNEAYLIEIGNHVAIADNALFITHDGGIWCYSDDPPNDDIFGRIKIGNNVHIGMQCIFLPNTTIGDNCIIGAGSVVRGKFPDNSVILGNPAKVMTNISVQKLLYSQNPGRLRTARLTDQQKEPIVKKHFGIK
jgi:acetyltransferase-like isoleucine patch superfamily enzyme